MARNEERLPNRFDVERAVEASALGPIGRHIILFLCTRMMAGSTLIPREHSPSLTRLAAGTGWDRRTVMRHLALLEQSGWLIRHRPDPHAARTRHARTSYTVLAPGLARGTPPGGVGAASPGAGGARPPGLGAGTPGARGTAPRKSDPSDHKTDQSGDMGELVARQLLDRTGVTVSREWAEQTAGLLLARPGIKNPRAYLIRTITTDPHPERWLPTPVPPPMHQMEES